MDSSDKFYTQLNDFKQKIEKLLVKYNKTDEIEELNVHYEKLLFLKKANLYAPIELFYKRGVLEYMDKILCKDESFFIDKLDTFKQDENLLVIDKIKSIWSMLDNDVKTNIWNYIRVLCIHSENTYLYLNSNNNGPVFFNKLKSMML